MVRRGNEATMSSSRVRSTDASAWIAPERSFTFELNLVFFRLTLNKSPQIRSQHAFPVGRKVSQRQRTRQSTYIALHPLNSEIYRTSRALDCTLVMIPRQKSFPLSTCSEMAQTDTSMDDEVSGKLKLSFSVQINPVAPAFLASFSISAMSAGE